MAATKGSPKRAAMKVVVKQAMKSAPKGRRDLTPGANAKAKAKAKAKGKAAGKGRRQLQGEFLFYFWFF